MTTYSPDKWVVIKIVPKDEAGKALMTGFTPVFKVLAGWGGSYLYGQSWKLNSGIESVTSDMFHYTFKGFSGSVYKCHRDAYGFTTLMANILADLQEQYKDAAEITVLPEGTNYLAIGV